VTGLVPELVEGQGPETLPDITELVGGLNALTSSVTGARYQPVKLLVLPLRMAPS